MPLSFCMVTTFYPPFNFGGDGVYVQRLSNELARRGHRVTVVHCVDAFAALGDRSRALPGADQEGVAVERLQSRLGRLSPLVTYLTGRPGLKAGALDRIFRGERFDVVHFHNISLVGGPGVLRYGEGIKLYTAHEHWLVCPMHVLWKNDREPCVDPQCLRCTLAFRRPPQLWRYGKRYLRDFGEVDLFLAPSRFALEAHRERGFTRPMRHMPYFLPAAAALPATPAAVEANRPYFLFVGRLEKLKGVHTLLQAFRDYHAADLLIAGDGTYGPELRRQAAGLPHVRFLGRVDSELRSLYAGAVALLVPSVGFETFGLVSLEAFAQKTPVIVRDLGGLTEAVDDSGGGLVFRTQTELLDAIETLRRDRTLRDDLGRRGYEAWQRLWSSERHLTRYFGLIEELALARGEADLAKAAAAATPLSGGPGGPATHVGTAVR